MICHKCPPDANQASSTLFDATDGLSRRRLDLHHMAIPPNTFIPIPRGLYIVMWLEFLLFVPFSISHYAGAFKSVWAVFAPNPLGKATFWQGEMLNGVGAWVLMYMLGSALWDGTISACEVEILFLSHALWYGVVFATEAPGPAFAVKAQANPHTWLYLGVIFTGYDLPRPICFLLSVGILAFGCEATYAPRWRFSASILRKKSCNFFSSNPF